MHRYKINISDFMAFYRETFPDASVLPKMHMLKSHILLYRLTTAWSQTERMNLCTVIVRAQMRGT